MSPWWSEFLYPPITVDLPLGSSPVQRDSRLPGVNAARGTA